MRTAVHGWHTFQWQFLKGNLTELLMQVKALPISYLVNTTYKNRKYYWSMRKQNLNLLIGNLLKVWLKCHFSGSKYKKTFKAFKKPVIWVPFKINAEGNFSQMAFSENLFSQDNLYGIGPVPILPTHRVYTLSFQESPLQF
jgi:hypothetical protein